RLPPAAEQGPAAPPRRHAGLALPGGGLLWHPDGTPGPPDGGSAVSLLVVGTLAFDSIETPHGGVDDILGGSATFFAYAASFFTRPRLVSVVGDDFPEEHRRLLAERGVDMAGVQTQQGGLTFRWKGRYHADMNNRDTVAVHLNVLETFDPV